MSDIKNKKTKKRKDPIKTLVKWLCITAVLAIAAMAGQIFLERYRGQLLQDRVAEVEAINAQRKQEYLVALAEFQQATASGVNLAWPAQKTEGWDVVDLTSYPLESVYTEEHTRQELMYDGVLLVNQWHSRPEDYLETGLVSIGSYTSGKIPVKDYNVLNLPVAINALLQALADAEAVGLKDYLVDEAYRSYAYQESLFQSQVSKLSSKYSGDELLAKAAESVNYPGTSEYNTGLSYRLRLYNRNDVSVGQQTFSTSEQGVWLAENCWRYGIIFRFPVTDFPTKGTADKSYKTGISTKMNLYRYVGQGNAAAMHTLDYCLEEYIEYLQEHPHIAVFEDGVLRYEIVRQNVGEAETFALQLNKKAASWSASLDNMGGAVIVFAY